MVPLLLLLLLALPSLGVRVATMNVFLGIEEPGTTSYDSLAAVLGRIDADVVGLQEVRSQDRSGNPSNLDQLAGALGYSHVFVPSGSDFDTNSDVVLLSKFPFLRTDSIGSPFGAKDVTRIHAAAKIDVPGTNDDPTIITLHLKCCFEMDDPFRRAVEMERVKNYLDSESLDGSDNVIVLGDFNLLGSPQIFNSLPPGLPSTYSLGSDISFPVRYFSDPVSYFTAYPLLNPMPVQQDGVTNSTFNGGSVLDFIVVSQALLDRAPVLEVYNSELEGSFPGLPKSGAPLPSGTSAEASDHYAIFGDFNLDSGSILNLSLASNVLSEGGAGTSLTVTLASPSTDPVTVLLCSAEIDEAMPQLLTLTFPAGSTSQTTTFFPQEDSIVDGDQTFVLMASAAGFQGDAVSVTVLDTDRSSYEISAYDTPVVEDFSGFAGTETPAAWNTSGGIWLGSDDGSSSAAGLRSYGDDGSIGIWAGGLTSFSVQFENLTGGIISTLEIDYLAEQWRAAAGGGLDRLQVSVVTGNGTLQIPELTFTSRNDLPSGSVAGGVSTPLSATLSGLSIAANETFQIVFSAVPANPNSGGGSAVFLNEFHYDNNGSDSDEFIEIVVGPDYRGNLADIQIVLYNGSNNSEYASHVGNTFTAGELTSSGHQIYSKDIPGIQNGAPDGIAIVVGGVVSEFLSYEGVMTAADGPAAGMTSVDIGVSQPTTLPSGGGSLGRTGTASGPAQFTWARSTGSFTQGLVNDGQAFEPSIPGQGIALDSLRVTARATASPAGSLSLSPDFILTFPTQTGFNYEVQTSTDLATWSFLAAASGNGALQSLDVSSPDPRRFYRIIISTAP